MQPRAAQPRLTKTKALRMESKISAIYRKWSEEQVEEAAKGHQNQAGATVCCRVTMRELPTLAGPHFALMNVFASRTFCLLSAKRILGILLR